MSNEKTGDYADRKQATRNLIEHLQKAIAYLQTNEIESPSCVGIIARSLEMVCYRQPLIEADEPLGNEFFLAPYNAFVGGFAGDFYSFEIETALGFDWDESNRQRDSIPIVIR